MLAASAAGLLISGSCGVRRSERTGQRSGPEPYMTTQGPAALHRRVALAPRLPDPPATPSRLAVGPALVAAFAQLRAIPALC